MIQLWKAGLQFLLVLNLSCNQMHACISSGGTNGVSQLPYPSERVSVFYGLLRGMKNEQSMLRFLCDPKNPVIFNFETPFIFPSLASRAHTESMSDNGEQVSFSANQRMSYYFWPKDYYLQSYALVPVHQ